MSKSIRGLDSWLVQAAPQNVRRPPHGGVLARHLHQRPGYFLEPEAEVDMDGIIDLITTRAGVNSDGYSRPFLVYGKKRLRGNG